MERIDIPNQGTGHDAPITGVAVDTTGRLVATSSYDGTLRVWDLDLKGTLTERATGRHLRLVNSVAWSPTPGVLASASADKTVTVWRYEDGRLDAANVLCRHTDDVNSVAWMPDGRRLVCVSEDGKATAWDAESGSFLDEISGHRAHCMMVATSSLGRVATVGEDGQVIVLGTDLKIVATTQYDCSIEGCAWSPDGARLAIARDDGVIDVLDADLASVGTVHVSTSAARSVAWSSTGEQLAAGSYEGGVRILDSNSLETTAHVDHPRLWTRSLAYAGDLVVTGGFGSEPLVLDPIGASVANGGGVGLRGPNALLVLPEALLVGTDSGEIVSHGLHDGRSKTLAQVGSPVLSLGGDERAVFAGAYGGEVVRIAPGSGGVESIGRADAPVPSLVRLHDRLVAGTYNGEFLTYDLTTLEVIERIQAHDGSVKSLARISDDVFAAASTDRTATVGTTTNRAAVLHHGNLLNAVAVAAGLIATASRDRTVRVGRLVEEHGTWRAVDVAVLTGADESLKCVGIIVDGDRALVVAGGYDFRLYAWDVDVARPSGDRPIHQVAHVFRQAASTICASSEGGLYAAGWDGEIIRVEAKRRGKQLQAVIVPVLPCCLHDTEEVG